MRMYSDKWGYNDVGRPGARGRVMAAISSLKTVILSLIQGLKTLNFRLNQRARVWGERGPPK